VLWPDAPVDLATNIGKQSRYAGIASPGSNHDFRRGSPRGCPCAEWLGVWAGRVAGAGQAQGLPLQQWRKLARIFDADSDHRKESGLPRRCAPRNDGKSEGGVLGRRGPRNNPAKIFDDVVNFPVFA